ncbi:WecB/TagA/CpsF family glycosyltransferase [Planctomicrobium piriforme]|uniref:Polymer biosynthesis protein, WecB/TagA/CpsF family n=1 Tax=Planctomicrobium piriforme TaxID=1576369 RepID=A0A1I3DDK2_9PLAN|nr:WecB/TagA/CpsF family glycosyltransferase [Planctomicrobium piriforme]SFH84860.1 polymer biosynthesis protein, WecB/TagA/CpsF family [Planctomicrobium piriforme]
MSKTASDRELLTAIADLLPPEITTPEQVASRIGGPGPVLVTFCNPLSVLMARKHVDFIPLLKRFDLVHADGILLAKSASGIRRRPIARLSYDGNSVGLACWNRLKEINGTVALVGGVEGVAQAAGNVLSESGLNVVYTHSGFFDGPEHRARVMQELIQLNPTAVISGMGAPHQERFVVALVDAGYQGFAATCGGYLDQLSKAGKASHYPEWVNRLNLRFVHRVLSEPRRMLSRYVFDYAPFYRAATSSAVAGTFRNVGLGGRREESRSGL